MRTNNPRTARSLTYTLTIAFLALSLIALVANGLFTLYTNIRRQQSVIIAQQQLIAQNASQEVSGFFEEKYRILEATTKIIELPKGSAEQRKLILQSLLATQPSFRQIVLLNEGGGEAAQVSRVSLEISEQFTTQLRKALVSQDEQSRRYISPIYFDDVTNEPLIVLAIPVNIWDFKGTLGVEVNLQFMWTLVDQLKVGETGYVYLVDNEGNLIAAKDTARVLAAENVKEISKVNEFISNPSTSAGITPDVGSYTGLLGIKVVGTYVPLGAPPWAVLTELPYNEAYRPVFQTVAVSAATILVMGFLAGLVGVIVARILAIPLVNLTETVTRIANGEIQLQAVGGGAKEIVSLATAFNTMTSQLRHLIGNLEGRVAERTADLAVRSRELEAANVRIQRRAAQFEALAQVTQTITAVRDLRELLPRIASVISEKFGFYHVGIFLLDEISQYAILSAANSEGGKKMLERKHRLRVGEEGIVGYATATGKPRIALDVGKDAVYFTNPELPDTHSEIALPLISKNIIVGALDVQSVEVAAFGDEDIRMLSLLADQVSLAIENARLFDDARKALVESEMISRSTVREAWARLPEEQKLLGYRYNVAGASPLRKLVKLAEADSAKEKTSKDEAGPAVVPIALRGEVIGNLIVQSGSGNKWNEDQLDLIRAVAERVALSAENARLFEETTARAERERLVSEITGRIRSQNDPQSMIRTAIEELRSALGASRVEVIPQSAKSTGKSES